MTWSYVLSLNHDRLNSYTLCSNWMSVFVLVVCLLHDTESTERAPKQRARCLRSSRVIGEMWQLQQQEWNMLQMLALWLMLDWWSVRFSDILKCSVFLNNLNQKVKHTKLRITQTFKWMPFKLCLKMMLVNTLCLFNILLRGPRKHRLVPWELNITAYTELFVNDDADPLLLPHCVSAVWVALLANVCDIVEYLGLYNDGKDAILSTFWKTQTDMDDTIMGKREKLA